VFTTTARKHWPWITGFVIVYGSIALLIDNSYYQLIMSNVLVWAVMEPSQRL
jgi:hypothetical protein